MNRTFAWTTATRRIGASFHIVRSESLNASISATFFGGKEPTANRNGKANRAAALEDRSDPAHIA
jgi:hypothetical protein